MSADLATRLQAEAHDLAAIGDPADRVRAVGDFLAQMDFELEQFAEVRLEAIAELRAQGLSYERVSKATGLSKARVAQLARMARAGGRRPRG